MQKIPDIGKQQRPRHFGKPQGFNSKIEC